MAKDRPRTLPPDQPERERALDAGRSVIVGAPAGSGKTDLLTRRFLKLLGEVEDPGQIVAITFTKAAAAEMRHRILSELEKAASDFDPVSDPISMRALAQRALARSQECGWNLLDLPAQLRISTIDAFCRDLALQQPLLSGLGGGLEINEQPAELYRRAARRTLEQIGGSDAALSEAIRALLLWRDNSWNDVETLLVEMLAKRDRWMHDFVLGLEPDWERLHEKLEAPFARAARQVLAALCGLLDSAPDACAEAHRLVQFACGQSSGALYRVLAELAEPPAAPFTTAEQIADAQAAYACLAELLLTGDGSFRKQVNVNQGFPKENKIEKAQFANLVACLSAISGLESALAAVRDLPPIRYTEEEWQIVRACFVLLRHAAGQLQVVFAETGTADYIQVAQIAQDVLKGDDGFPSDAALAVADGIRHLLVDEFQDTSRRQHQLLACLIAAWPEREGRTCFVVGDPMQSIYFFRDADAELFPRVQQLGLEILGDEPQRFDPVQLKANFRTATQLVNRINAAFALVFAANDGSEVTFTEALPARDRDTQPGPHLIAEPADRMQLHLEFVPAVDRGNARGTSQDRRETIAAERDAARQSQTDEIVALISSHMTRVEQARTAGEKYRIAVLGRTKKALAPIAVALREAGIPFRAVELEELKQRPEIMDALALGRALLNPEDRVAWLGVLRAPWCGLSLADLHALTSADDPELLALPVPELMANRLNLLSGDGRIAVLRVLEAIQSAERLRYAQPAAALGTWLEQVWLRLGGADCVDRTSRANLDLLWSSLDSLADGEPDLLGTALGAALDKLTAQPDPAADSEHGVQLMTIHKSKGLEFEVVIVPELQAGANGGNRDLLSWLERGLLPESGQDEPSDSGEITEILVAPLPPKGVERGHAKQWVDRVRRERESQEMRRILYVAATRAREELHLFARPEFKTEKDGSLVLSESKNSLLATIWPAFEAEIQARFSAWQELTAESSTIETIAAEADDSPVVISPPASATRIRRLPPDYRAGHGEFAGGSQDESLVGAGRLYERHEGGLLSRALGNAVHMLLQQLAQLASWQPLTDALAALPQLQPRAAAEVRAIGVDAQLANRVAAQALQIALQAATDPVGRWILAPHEDAANEIRWTGVVNGNLRTVQVDRIFRAGAAPQASGESGDRNIWWIIDYKTSHEDGLDPAAALPELRRDFAPQLEAYAQVLRNLRGIDANVQAGIYYPRMKLLDSWEL